MMVSPTEAYCRSEPPSTLMQNTFLAPELSATSSTEVIWIMKSLSSSHSGLGGLLDDLRHAPPLVLRHRARLGDEDFVALVDGNRLRVIVIFDVRLVLHA